MIVCKCQVTSDREVAAAIADGACCLDSIADRCGAGIGCGSCKRYLEDALRDAVSDCECATPPAFADRQDIADQRL